MGGNKYEHKDEVSISRLQDEFTGYRYFYCTDLSIEAGSGHEVWGPKRHTQNVLRVGVVLRGGRASGGTHKTSHQMKRLTDALLQAVTGLMCWCN